MEALEQLKSVLCDPEGNVCISGSDGDRKVISDALESLEQQVAALAKQREALELALAANGYGYDACRCAAALHTVQSAQQAIENALANPATILELCALLEKAEEALKGVKVYVPPSFANTHSKCNEALAAIKQWKEQER